MNTIIEELLNYSHTRYVTRRAMRVIDQHLNTKKWFPKIIVVSRRNGDTYTTINGKKHGPQIEWGGCENKWKECEYVNGQLHGLYQSWWSNGTKFRECEYRNGQLHGSYKRWDLCGRHLEQECEYNNGKFHGLYKEWWNGKQFQECNYNNGKLHGLHKKWWHDRWLEEPIETMWDNGELREHKNGKLKEVLK